MTDTSPFASVIIPVYNDSERLKKCLGTLENQTYDKNLYEVIVVDNDSTEDIKSVVEQFGQAIFAHESTPGSFTARNKGISLAKGEVIAFTDVDCIPAHDWIEKGVATLLSAPNCGLVAGKIEVFFKDQKRPTAVELYENIVAYQQEKYIKENKQGITANIFTLKSVIDKVGPFDDKLWEMADYEWGRRVFSAGYGVIYADDARVAHPARHSLKGLYRKAAKITIGMSKLEKKKIRSFGDVIKTFARYISSTCKDILSVCKDKRLNVIQRFQVVFIIFFIRFVYIFERTKILICGRTRR